MKNLKRLPTVLVATFWLLLFSFNSSAQNVGINATGATPDGSALLDLSATDKGFLITRVDTANISSPAFGLMTLSPLDSCLYMQNGETSGKTWISIGGVGVDCPCGTSSPSSPPIGSCGDPFTDARDGKTYGTVQIGNQRWMCENLAYLPSVVGPGTGNSTNPYYYVDGYNGTDVAAAKSQSNYSTYGVLYNWPAIMDGTSSSSTNPSGVQGVCPTGWHLPSDAEWKELEMELGMSQVDADNIGFRGTNEGGQLKASSFGGNNASGFTALPGGVRSPGGGTSGSFFSEGLNGYWWSATESGTAAWLRNLNVGRSDVQRHTFVKGFGLPVRCIRN